MNTSSSSIFAALGRAKEHRSSFDVPRGCLLIGDSMIRNIDPDRLDTESFLFAYPGIKARQLASQIQNEYLPPPAKIGLIICHVGTNNVSTRHDVQHISNICLEILLVVQTLRTLYPAAVIVLSGVLPRQDEANSRGVELNEKLRDEIETQDDERLAFVDYSASFGNPFFFRFKSTRRDEFPDAVHLSEEGVVRLQELLRVEIHKREQIVLKNSQSPLAEAEWNVMRQNTFKMREPTRFKVTNYAPDTDSKCHLQGGTVAVALFCYRCGRTYNL